MNFAYGIIAIVGVLAAISIGLVAVDPDFVIEPRIVEVKPVACTLEWTPMCGVDGVTYGNSCMLDAANVKLDHSGECTVNEISVQSSIMPSTATAGDVLLIEVEFRDDDGNVVDHVNYDILSTQDGNTILSELGSHRHPGKHPIHETTTLGTSDVEIRVIVQGLGHDTDITGPNGIETIMTIVPESAPEEIPIRSGMIVSPEIHIISTPQGSGAPGCEDTDSCYLPSSLEIRVGDTISWSNDDSAAHTVTSGNVSDGTDGVFDSGLFMAGSTFEFTFEKVGTYDYFCMVHPWMTGKVIVSEISDMMILESEPVMEEPVMEEPVMEEPVMEEPVMEEPPSEQEMTTVVAISVPLGVAVPGCEDTHSCYLPYEVTISVGDKVTWSNDDSAIHTVTSGNASAGLTGVFDSGLFMAGSTFEFTFEKVGTYDYFCMVHPWMTGKVIVK